MAQEISLHIGTTEDGEKFTLPLTQSPHVLVGGTSGSGKSTLLHQMITSLVQSYSNRQLCLYIGDPKIVEFRRYERAPQVRQVAKSVEEHIKMLETIVKVMMKRYAIMESARDEYGHTVDSAYCDSIMYKCENGLSATRPLRIPNIIVIIDEFGNLVLDKEYGKRVSDRLIAISQLGRAAGITLVLATQHPTAKIVDPRIKANCATRIALRVTSGINSRVILDSKGAEMLKGCGEALVLSPAHRGKIKVQIASSDKMFIETVIDRACLGDFWINGDDGIADLQPHSQWDKALLLRHVGPVQKQSGNGSCENLLN